MANFRKLTNEAKTIRDGETAHVKTVGGKRNAIEKGVDYKELLAMAISLGCLDIVEAGGKVMDEDGKDGMILLFVAAVILVLFVGFWVGWKAHSIYVQTLTNQAKSSGSEHTEPVEDESVRRRSKRWTRRLKIMEID